MEQRLVELELKATSLEDMVLSLNDRVYEQQKQLDELRALCRLLIQRQEEQSGSNPASYQQERPPHY